MKVRGRVISVQCNGVWAAQKSAFQPARCSWTHGTSALSATPCCGSTPLTIATRGASAWGDRQDEPLLGSAGRRLGKGRRRAGERRLHPPTSPSGEQAIRLGLGECVALGAVEASMAPSTEESARLRRVDDPACRLGLDGRRPRQISKNNRVGLSCGHCANSRTFLKSQLSF